MNTIRELLTARFGSLTAAGRCWMWAGLITLAVSMGMAYDYAAEVSFKHGVAMACLSFATAFLVEEAYAQYKKGLTGVAIGLVAVSIPLFWQEGKSHIAYTAGFRGINVEKADIQHIKVTDARNNVGEREAMRDKLIKDLADLEAKNAYATTTTATALRAQLGSAQKAIDLETARGGCKSKCLLDIRAKEALEGRIATVERREDMTKQIAALKAELSAVREKSAAVEHKPSIVSHQNNTLFKIASLFRDGKSDGSPMLKEAVELENTIGLALVPVILPALCFFMMGLYRKEEDEAQTGHGASSTHAQTPTEPTITRMTPDHPTSRPVHRIETLTVADLMKLPRAA